MNRVARFLKIVFFYSSAIFEFVLTLNFDTDFLIMTMMQNLNSLRNETAEF